MSPGARCNWLATAAGTAAETGLPSAGRPCAAPDGGLGQEPAVSTTCALIRAGAATSASAVTPARAGPGSPSGSDHRALLIVTAPVPNTACIERRTTRSSCCAIAASTAPLTTTEVPLAVAS